MAGLQVFGQPASTDVARVLTCLFEKNLEFELVRTDTFKKSHKLPEFIKLRVCRCHHLGLCLSHSVVSLSVLGDRITRSGARKKTKLCCAWNSICRILLGR